MLQHARGGVGEGPGEGSFDCIPCPCSCAAAAGAATWPTEFVCPEGQKPTGAAPPAACGAGEPAAGGEAAGAELLEGGEAVRLLQPAWVHVGTEGGSISGRSGGSGAEEGGGAGGSSPDDGASPAGLGASRRQPDAKRARLAGAPEGGPRLPLLYPPLRFFLSSGGDIRAAYTPE